MPALLNFWEPLVSHMLLSLQDAPAVVVIVVFFMAWVCSWLPIGIILALTRFWQPDKPLEPEQKLPLLVSLYLLAPLIIWGAIEIENTSVSDYGLIGRISILSSLGVGFSLGIFSLGLIFICQWWLGFCSFNKSHIKQLPSIILPILLLGLLVGGIEELVFRGFLLTHLQQDYPLWVAAIISSSIFAFLHLIWEQTETIPQLPGLWLMGMVLVLARLVDGGNLGLAWGLHTGWVWAIACLDTTEVITYNGKISEWVTGKNNKPLAGVAGILCLLLTGGVLWLFSGYI